MPEVAVVANGIVDRSNKDFTNLHVVIRMLVRSQQFSATSTRVVCVIRLDEAVIRQSSPFAVRKELIVVGEAARLGRTEASDRSRARLVEVIKLRRSTHGQHAVENALIHSLSRKRPHVYSAKGGAKVGETVIAQVWTRDRRKPAVEDGETARECG